MKTQVNGPAIKRWAGMFVTLLAMTVFLVTSTQAAEKKLSQNESPVMEATETASFGTEDFAPAQGETQVLVMETPAYGTEDWIEPPGETRIVAVAPAAYGTEDWTGTMESSEAVGAGVIPEPACKDVSPDDYSPEC